MRHILSQNKCYYSVIFGVAPKTPSWNRCPQIFSRWGTEKCNVSYTNNYHDVTDLVNYKIAKNSKTWISWTEDNFSIK